MIEKNILLQLIRLGLGIGSAYSDAANAKPFFLSAEEWNEVLSLAKEQAVVGLLVSAIELLPDESRPPKPLLMQIIALSERIRQQNNRLDAVLAELVQEWHDIGIAPIVVKGQVVAREYPEPAKRSSGDIDVFIASQHWLALERWIAGKGILCRRSAAEKHIELTYKGVQVELHYHLNAFSSAKANSYWTDNIEGKAIENSRAVEIKSSSGAAAMATIGDDACIVRTLGVTDTLLHLMVHVHHHLLTEGVGLRQLIDMALFLNNHAAPLQLSQNGGRDGEIDFSLLRQHLHGIGHHKAFAAYSALMNKYLGLPKEKIPCELDLEDYVYADKIMREVWRGGNFGHKNNLNGVKPGLLHSLNTATLVLRHSLQFHRLAPAESRGYWWNKIFWRMKRK